MKFTILSAIVLTAVGFVSGQTVEDCYENCKKQQINCSTIMNKGDCMHYRYECVDSCNNSFMRMGLHEACWDGEWNFGKDCVFALPAGDCMHFRQDLHAECNCFVSKGDHEDCWAKCELIQNDCNKVLNPAICQTYRMQCTKQCNEGCVPDLLATA